MIPIGQKSPLPPSAAKRLERRNLARVRFRPATPPPGPMTHHQLVTAKTYADGIARPTPIRWTGSWRPAPGETDAVQSAGDDVFPRLRPGSSSASTIPTALRNRLYVHPRRAAGHRPSSRTRSFAYNAQLQEVSETICGLYNKTLTRTYTSTGMKGKKPAWLFGEFRITHSYDITDS